MWKLTKLLLLTLAMLTPCLASTFVEFHGITSARSHKILGLRAGTTKGPFEFGIGSFAVPRRNIFLSGYNGILEADVGFNLTTPGGLILRATQGVAYIAGSTGPESKYTHDMFGSPLQFPTSLGMGLHSNDWYFLVTFKHYSNGGSNRNVFNGVGAVLGKRF